MTNRAGEAKALAADLADFTNGTPVEVLMSALVVFVAAKILVITGGDEEGTAVGFDLFRKQLQETAEHLKYGRRVSKAD